MFIQNLELERFGLMDNPFQFYLSEDIHEISPIHINQEIDKKLAILKESILNKSQKSISIIIGNEGEGKTHRLLLAKEEAAKTNIFTIFFSINLSDKYVITGLLEEIKQLKQSHSSVFTVLTRLKSIKRTIKNFDKSFEPDEIGSLIAKVLNENSPSFFLVNDLQNTSNKVDSEHFMLILKEITNKILPGVFILISCNTDFFERLVTNYSWFIKDIDTKIRTSPLLNQDAASLIAKRINSKRFVDDIESLYPFDNEAINYLNKKVNGNPGLLISKINYVINYAAQRGDILINSNLSKKALDCLDKFEHESKELSSCLDKNKNKQVYDQNNKINDNITIIPNNIDNNNIDENSIVNREYNDLTTIDIKSINKVFCLRCPECLKEFSIEIRTHEEIVSCPFCEFSGKLTD
jgi:hypothetical protein